MVTSCMITKRSTYGVHVLSQSILLQKQRLGHLLVKSGPAAEKKKKLKEEISAESQSRSSYNNSQWHHFISYYLLGVVSYPEF